MSRRTVVDPHIHVWDQRNTPRKTSMLVRMFGWNPALLQTLVRVAFPKDIVQFFGFSPDVVSDYMPLDHRKDCEAYTLSATVHVQAGWEGKGPMGPVGETAWLDGLKNGPAGIVGFAELERGDAVDAVLQGHHDASPSRFRGIRRMLAHHDDPGVHSFAPRAGLGQEAEFQAGFACLARRDLSFDAWCYHHQLGDVIALAKRFPEVPIVLCHLGTPVGIGGPYAGLGHSPHARQDIFKAWADDLEALAEHPNVVAKISGLTMPVLGWGYHQRPSPPAPEELAEDLAPLVAHALAVFGPERCMFASNFPVDRVSVSYSTLYEAYGLLSAELSDAEQEALFVKNAVRVYRLDV